MPLLIERVSDHVSQFLLQCSLTPGVSNGKPARLPIRIERVDANAPFVPILHGGVQGASSGGVGAFAEQRVPAERDLRLVRPCRSSFSREADDAVVYAFVTSENDNARRVA